MAELSAQRLAVLMTAAAIGLAACGGSSSPHVASLGTSSSGRGTSSDSGSSGTTPAAAQGSPTQLLDEWASCMRRHGDPNQLDPTIDANKLIHVKWNPAIPGGLSGTNKGGQGNSGPGQYCRSYLDRAQTALSGGPPKQPDPGELLKFSACMQANGIPDFPDPTGTNLSIPMNGGGDLNPTNPVFRKASILCAHKTGLLGLSGSPQPGTIELNGGLPVVAGG
ncbi:MAG: hypothetical protein JO342_01845 [Solirubrobacterales bacterium]|nr:hypothetical protein [Solirubrobacterales bacterium]